MKKTIFTVGCFLSLLNLQAQSTLWLQPKGASVKPFDFDELRSISFTNGNLQANLLQNTVDSRNLRQVQKLFFTKGSATGLWENRSKASFQVKLFPNPATSQIVTLVYELPVSGEVAISLTNMKGSVQKEMTLQGKVGSNEMQWDVKDVPLGVYVYQVKVGEYVATGKLIK